MSPRILTWPALEPGKVRRLAEEGVTSSITRKISICNSEAKTMNESPVKLYQADIHLPVPAIPKC